MAVLMAACGGSSPPARLGVLVCHGKSSHFELDLAHSYGGQPSPVAAAEWDAVHHAIPGFRVTS